MTADAPGIFNRGAIGLIRVYQATLSRLWPGRCRFYPSCSQYAVECFEIFPFWKAGLKSGWRILRCNPLSQGYFDPVLPAAEEPAVEAGESGSGPN